MMKIFENPKIQISKFDIENIVTTSAGTTLEKTINEQAEQVFEDNNISTENVFKIVL